MSKFKLVEQITPMTLLTLPFVKYITKYVLKQPGLIIELLEYQSPTYLNYEFSVTIFFSKLQFDNVTRNYKSGCHLLSFGRCCNKKEDNLAKPNDDIDTLAIDFYNIWQIEGQNSNENPSESAS